MARVASPAPFAACAQEWLQRERVWKGERARIQAAGEVDLARLSGQWQATGQEDTEALIAAERSALERRQAWVAQIASRARKRLQNEVQQALAAVDRSLRAVREGEQRSPLSEAVTSEITTRHRVIAARCLELLEHWRRLHAATEVCARLGRCQLEEVPEDAAPSPLEDLEGRISLMDGHLTRAAHTLDGIHASWAYSHCRWWGQVRIHLLAALPCALWAVLHGMDLAPMYLSWLVGAAIVLQAFALNFSAFCRWQLAGRVRILDRVLVECASQIRLLAAPATQEAELRRLLIQRQLITATSEHAAQTKALKDGHERALGVVRKREQALRERLSARILSAETRCRQQAGERLAARRARIGAEQASCQQQLDGLLAACDRTWADERAALTGRWEEALASLVRTAHELLACRRRRHPEWSDAGWSQWTPPASYASDLPLGVFTRSAAAIAKVEVAALPPPPVGMVIELPAMLTFPGQANLLVRAPLPDRRQALRFINTLLLRALNAFPGGGLRLILVDPVGLGNSFAGLLELKDHDDALLGAAGVLVEPERIEQGLQDLSLHLETVIQKHLRGRYESLYDYNLVAGELREAIRLLVVADFPTGFGERALERLNIIARSGPRCGVHLLVLSDERRQLPPPLELSWFRSHALVVGCREGRLHLEQEGLEEWSFLPEAEPEPALAARIIAGIGQEAHRSRRVAVHFSHLLPEPGAVWSLSSSASVRIPVGKRGAEGLQYIELGRGTAQHALIGGRTGSGKSTLFHVLITSAALWYAPQELQFHLIDFKKGVEFKIYASHRLPHAQIIAIESDREFGLSVLRHLDHELARRGDAFRRAGAQDLAAYRVNAREHLPRVLLLIDEFQEFFTEDDAIARDAALLLDRFVRQGRAFGLHVVLGSQTLGGSYSMAKSSLGQMGVRIALPCNEADAHLLLHEDNDAARLLSRPGDAIYNDQAGLAEGNSPFQVCWLPEDQEAGHLELIARRADAERWHPLQPPVIFEGNGPSRLEDMPELMAFLAGTAPQVQGQMRICLGQSSSLKGPAEVVLPRAAGGNLLIMGQNREAAVSTCTAIVLGLATRWPASALRVLALDGEEPEGPFGTVHALLARTLPHACLRHDARGLEPLLVELSELLDARQAGKDPGTAPVLLLVFALQRLRQLRSDDDLAPPRSGGEPPPERFARLLANGPEYGIHVVMWCDSLNSLTRSLGRRAQRDFDLRILFQMSSADSNELLDDDAASRLGLHTALLSVLSEGRRDKFRPFSTPPPALWERFHAAFAAC